MNPPSNLHQAQSSPIVCPVKVDWPPLVEAQGTAADEVQGATPKPRPAICWAAGLFVGLLLVVILSNQNGATVPDRSGNDDSVPVSTTSVRPASPFNGATASKTASASRPQTANTGISAVSRLLTKIEQTDMELGDTFLADELAAHGKAALPQISEFRKKWADRQFEIEQFVRIKFAFQNVYAFDFPEFHQARSCVHVADRAAELIHRKKK